MTEDPLSKREIFRTGLGQDSHRFLSEDSSKLCIIGGVIFEEMPGLAADSDGDVVYHAICNAITSLTNAPILSKVAIDLCKKDGITDSRVYLEKAFQTLKKQQIVHLALSIEAKRPRLQHKLDEMKKNICSILNLSFEEVGITATSGDGLTDFGCGVGIQCFCILTTREFL